jgi:hypothetical protein
MKAPGNQDDGTARFQKRILFYLVLPAAALYLGLRLYAQYRPVDIYVSQVAPMPKELAAGLHMEEHKISPVVTVETPYSRAEHKMLSMDEVRRLRTQLAWNGTMPALVDSLTIRSSTQVLARRMTRRYLIEYELVRRGSAWFVESKTRNEIQRPPR